MSTFIGIVIAAVGVIALAMAVRIVQQYEEGVLFRLGRVKGVRMPGLALIVPFADVLRRVSLRIVRCRFNPRASSPATTSASTCQQ